MHIREGRLVRWRCASEGDMLCPRRWRPQFKAYCGCDSIGVSHNAIYMNTEVVLRVWVCSLASCAHSISNMIIANALSTEAVGRHW